MQLSIRKSQAEASDAQTVHPMKAGSVFWYEGRAVTDSSEFLEWLLTISGGIGRVNTLKHIPTEKIALRT